MIDMFEIEGLAKEYAQERAALGSKINALEEEVARLKNKHLSGIKKAAQRTAEKKEMLYSAIEENP